MMPFCTRVLIYSGVALAVEFDKHQTASLLISRDASDIIMMILSIRPMSIHFWICIELPAVTFEIDQQISFLTAFLVWSRSSTKASSTP